MKCIGSLAWARKLGVAGSIFIFLSLVLPLFPLPKTALFFLNLVGLVLILIAVRHVSEALTDKSIFNNMLIYSILAISTIVASIWMSVNSVLPPTISTSFGIFYLVFAISTLFLKRSYNIIADKLNVKKFSKVALLVLIGALLPIPYIAFILFDGFPSRDARIFLILSGILQGITTYVAVILQAVAFLSIHDENARSLKETR